MQEQSQHVNRRQLLHAIDVWCAVKGDGHHWAIDLNTTIQQLHAEKVWLYISLT